VTACHQAGGERRNGFGGAGHKQQSRFHAWRIWRIQPVWTTTAGKQRGYIPFTDPAWRVASQGNTPYQHKWKTNRKQPSGFPDPFTRRHTGKTVVWRPQNGREKAQKTQKPVPRRFRWNRAFPSLREYHGRPGRAHSVG
jgi:hypothetical protein